MLSLADLSLSDGGEEPYLIGEPAGIGKDGRGVGSQEQCLWQYP